MSATTKQTTDIAKVLHDLIDAIPDVRSYAYVADTVRVPAAVIGQPELDFEDQSSGFCKATWTFPITLIVKRSNERTAQQDLSKLILDVVTALNGEAPDGVLSIEPMNARPLPGVSVGGQELPAYQLNVRVRA